MTQEALINSRRRDLSVKAFICEVPSGCKMLIASNTQRTHYSGTTIKISKAAAGYFGLTTQVHEFTRGFLT